MVKLKNLLPSFYTFKRISILGMSRHYCYSIIGIMLLGIFLLNVQSTFAQDDDSNKIEVELEEAISTKEDSPGDEPESKEVTLEESISMEEDKGDEPILSPLKQMRSGIPAEDVECKTGFNLIIKASDGSAACVTPSTASALAERGWSK